MHSPPGFGSDYSPHALAMEQNLIKLRTQILALESEIGQLMERQRALNADRHVVQAKRAHIQPLIWGEALRAERRTAVKSQPRPRVNVRVPSSGEADGNDHGEGVGVGVRAGSGSGKGEEQKDGQAAVATISDGIAQEQDLGCLLGGARRGDGNSARRSERPGGGAVPWVRRSIATLSSVQSDAMAVDSPIEHKATWSEEGGGMMEVMRRELPDPTMSALPTPVGGRYHHEETESDRSSTLEAAADAASTYTAVSTSMSFYSRFFGFTSKPNSPQSEKMGRDLVPPVPSVPRGPRLSKPPSRAQLDKRVRA